MFAANVSAQAGYWDNTWSGRIDDGGVKMNIEKMRFLLEELYKRRYYQGLNILEVGCGSGIHAKVLRDWWGEINWTGIDLSEVAVKKARKWELNASVNSIYDLKTGRFDAFWFLDVLEHLEDHDRVAAAVRKLAKKKFFIFGNIPLYSDTDHGEACERPMSRDDLARFLGACGMKKFWQRIYGSYGYPYMIFEAKS